jgi:hypothetical protein
MDAMRAAKDVGCSSLKVMQTYYGIRNSARNTVTTTAAISERGVRGFGLGFHVMETENLHVFEQEFLDVEEGILDVMTVENLHVSQEEFLDGEEEIV